MDNPSPIAQQIQALEAYIKTLVESIQQGKLPVNLQPISLVTDGLLTAIPRLSLPPDKFCACYNDVPTVLSAYAITVNLSADSYRQTGSSLITYDRASNGNYWIIPLGTDPQQAWLVPNPTRSLNLAALKSLNAAFDWPDRNTTNHTTFNLVEPALVTPLATSPLTWKLTHRGQIVTFLHPDLQQPAKPITLEQVEAIVARAMGGQAPPAIAPSRESFERASRELRENPKPTPSLDASNYYDRAKLKSNQGDLAGSMADYNQAIAMEPNYAKAYGGRGALKYEKLNDIPSAIDDLRQAAKLAWQQGDSQYTKLVLEVLESLGATN